MQAQTVVIVGAGISGLQVARALLKRGQHPLVIEQGEAVGGIWTNKAYPRLGVHVPHAYYEFAEFPWPAELLQDAAAGSHPSTRAVQAYVQAYAEHFGLLQHIRFRCQLLRLQPAAQGGWAVIYLDKASGLFQVVTADFVVMATGMHVVPNVPVYKGMQHFRGLQLHSNDLTDPSLLAGKRVVVVGGGRSALDYAAMVTASQVAASVTWLYRQAHWPIPQQLAPGLPAPRLLFSRLPALLLPPYYTATVSQRGMSKITADVLLYCTGYTRSYEFLDKALRARLGLQKDGLPLFRHILPPALPGFAFVGSEAASFNVPLTAGLQAEWLAGVLAGT
ncbi:hypothetical protein OEZ85_000146 [Tetradesmus obliquus]|uniref:Flavin-containing monooxygenase n=1 Tax=Tetradesmus obliquus TaxID=3088 RepID=A0ABY8USW4_TETOB|nr:hypothetical protein OEZ85_000146 [Tetradesmus obliquus]